MTEYHCEFCGRTGQKLKNEETGCCNNCGAPIGITKEKAREVYDLYYSNLISASTATFRQFPPIEVSSVYDHERKFINA
jgi:DNA-directed RNA polymerase subunit RPC12/RpoP